MENLKKNIKHMCALILSHVRREKKRASGATLTIVTYHRVLPAQHIAQKFEQPGMIVTPETLEKQLQWLKQRYTVIALDQWEARKHEEEEFAVVTFDDGWRDNYEYAFPLLDKYEVPFTLFLVSGKIKSDNGFWPTDLAECLYRYKCSNLEAICAHPVLGQIGKELFASKKIEKKNLSQEKIDSVLSWCKKHKHDTEMLECVEAIKKYLAKENIFIQKNLVDLADVVSMQKSKCTLLGSHTVSHLRLDARADDQLVTREIVQSKEELEGLVKQPITLFCYPNGDYTDFSREEVSKHYDLAVTTEKGVNTSVSDMYTLKRFSMHEDTTNTKPLFLAKLYGWF